MGEIIEEIFRLIGRYVYSLGLPSGLRYGRVNDPEFTEDFNQSSQGSSPVRSFVEDRHSLLDNLANSWLETNFTFADYSLKNRHFD